MRSAPVSRLDPQGFEPQRFGFWGWEFRAGVAMPGLLPAFPCISPTQPPLLPVETPNPEASDEQQFCDAAQAVHLLPIGPSERCSSRFVVQGTSSTTSQAKVGSSSPGCFRTIVGPSPSRLNPGISPAWPARENTSTGSTACPTNATIPTTLNQ